MLGYRLCRDFQILTWFLFEFKNELNEVLSKDFKLNLVAIDPILISVTFRKNISSSYTFRKSYYHEKITDQIYFGE